MKNLNVSIEDEVMDAVKEAAAQDGMLLRKWVERALRDAAAKTNQALKLREPGRELRYEPAE